MRCSLARRVVSTVLEDIMRERQSLFLGTFIVGGFAILAACSGDTGSPGTDGANGLVNAVPEPAGANFPYGGTKLVFGIDANDNGVLDTDEVRPAGTSYVCNGRGTSSLVRTSPEPNGVNCPFGGTRIETGLDVNNDNALGS